MKMIVATAAIGLLAGGAHAQAPTPSWEARLYNPKPAAGDLVLPMPCGGAMALRPVAVPTGAGPLDDRAIELGAPDSEHGYNDFQRGAFLAAPFAQGDTRVFFIGKYDVTRDQYAAVSGTCPQPSPRGRVAQADISWYDAVDFTQRWTSWLLANDRDALPKRAGIPGFVRLPTEAEWEYAARGGAAVSDSDYRAPTWPMPEGVERYAVAGASGSDGHAAQVGTLMPNPLGLYDMLGNVQQWMLDPYRLNRVGRSQGLAGGFVARGGSYATPLEQLSTAMRIEVPPFDVARNTPTRLAFVGFRVVLGAGAGGGLQETSQLEQAFTALQGAPNAVEDPRAIIAQLKQQTADPAVRSGLDNLAARLASADRERSDTGLEALRAQMEAATALEYVIWRVQVLINVQQAQLVNPEFKDLQGTPEFTRLRNAIATNQADQQTALDAYARLLREAALGHVPDDVARQAAILEEELRTRADRRRRFVAVAAQHMAMLAAQKPLPQETMLAAIIAIPAQTP
jgi:formylglycine-generating enzyme required for sulfatase activity